MRHKLKYLEIKEHLSNSNLQRNDIVQKGGLWSQHIDTNEATYRNIQREAKKQMILLKGNQDDVLAKLDEVRGNISDKLTNLFRWDEDKGKLNIDFLNDFYQNIPYDLEDPKHEEHNMHLAMEGGNFKYPDKLAYELARSGIKSGGGDIYFLKKKDGINPDLPQDLVLKVFTDEEFDKMSTYIPMNFYQIYPHKKKLNIGNITTRLASIGMESYQMRNYNKLDNQDLIRTESDDKYLVPWIKSSNYINEIIQFLIIDKIYNDHKDLNPRSNSYVSYINFYIAKYDGKYRGFVIMEKLKGDMSGFFEEFNGILLKIYNTNWAEKRLVIQNLFWQVINQLYSTVGLTLDLLKQKPFMFTHTDLKIENIFYKTVQVENPQMDNFQEICTLDNEQYGKYNVDGIDYYAILSDGSVTYYKFLIADYDKCSVTFNGLRFVNDYASNRAMMSRLGLNPEQVQDSYYDFKQDITSYQIVTGLSELAPLEVFAMRYSPFPFFLGWDYQSIAISIFSHMILLEENYIFPGYVEKNYQGNESSKLIANEFRSVIGENYKIHHDAFHRVFPDVGAYKGDFSKFMKPYRLNPDIRLSIIKIPEMNLHRDKIFKPGRLFLTNKEHKLIVSLPFIAKPIKTEHSTFGYHDWFYYLDYLKTNGHFNKMYAGKLIDNTTYRKLVRFLSESQEKVMVEFSGTVNPGQNNLLYATNRYSKAAVTGTYVYEWDDVSKHDDIAAIITYFAQFLPELPRQRV